MGNIYLNLSHMSIIPKKSLEHFDIDTNIITYWKKANIQFEDKDFISDTLLMLNFINYSEDIYSCYACRILYDRKFKKMGKRKLTGSYILECFFTSKFYLYSPVFTKKLPKFICRTAIASTLCSSCFKINILISLLQNYKMNIRNFLREWSNPASSKKLHNMLLQKLFDSKTTMEKNTLGRDSVACRKCKILSDTFNLRIRCEFTIGQRQDIIEEFIKYFQSPSPAIQNAYFIMTSRLPQDISKNIISFLDIYGY